MPNFDSVPGNFDDRLGLFDSGGIVIVPPIQSAVFGPGSGSSFPAQFTTQNVVLGDIIIVAIWLNNGYIPATTTATDDAGNTYSLDCERGSSAASDNTYAVILSTTVVHGAGTKLTVTVSMPGNVGLARLYIAEYPKAAATRFDTSASAFGNGVTTVPTVSLTTATTNELLFSTVSWGGYDFPVGTHGTGYTLEDNQNPAAWGGLMQDRATTTIGSYSATASISTDDGGPGQVVVLLAAYRIATPTVYDDVISLGVGAATAPQAAVSFAGSLAFGVAGGTADLGAASIADIATLGLLAGTSDSAQTSLSPQAAFGVLAGTTDAITAAMAMAVSLGTLDGTAALAASVSFPSLALGVGAAIAGSVAATIRDVVLLGVLDGTSSVAALSVSGAAQLGVGASAGATAATSLLASIALGNLDGISGSANASVAGSVSLGALAGTSASIQAIIAGAIAAGIIQGISASPGGGGTIYSDAIGLGVGAAALAGAQVGASLALTLGAQAGATVSGQLNVNEIALLAALFTVQPTVLMQAATNVGLAVGVHLATSPAVVFRDQIALAAFAATLARTITPATVRLLTVPLLQRSFVAKATRTVVQVPVLQRAFIGQEEVMLYLFKHPGSTEDFSIDLTSVADNTTIDSISVPAVGGLTIVDRGASLPMATLRIGGGVAGQGYLISVLATLDSGEIKVVNLTLAVVLVAGLVNATQVPVDKDPRSNENFQLVWTPMLGADAIASSSWQASPPVPVTNPTFDDQSASAWLGVSANGRHSLTNTVTTVSGQVKACDLFLMVAPQ